LTESYQLGIVSNFKVPGGIEELLKLNGIERYFNSVTVSINMGWRKPHEAIYHHALNFMDALPEDIYFIGDDFKNDYLKPRELGLKGVLLDRFNRHPEVTDRVKDFYELIDYLYNIVAHQINFQTYY
jgi:putative hydrolase of the HAD superfamily